MVEYCVNVQAILRYKQPCAEGGRGAHEKHARLPNQASVDMAKGTVVHASNADLES